MGPIIKYKGLEIDNAGKLLKKPHWRYGYCRVVMGTTYIGDDGVERPVDPKTVGQFTGILDSNEKEVYTGDIFEVTFHPNIYEPKYNSDGVECGEDYTVHPGVEVKFAVIWQTECAGFSAQIIDVEPKGVLVGSTKIPRREIAVGDIHALDDFFNEYRSEEIIGNIYEKEAKGE